MREEGWLRKWLADWAFAVTLIVAGGLLLALERWDRFRDDVRTFLQRWK